MMHRHIILKIMSQSTAAFFTHRTKVHITINQLHHYLWGI